MKIIFVGAKGITEPQSGIDKHIKELAVRMAEAGHEVSICVRKRYVSKDLKEFKGVQIIRFSSFPTRHLETLSYSLLVTIHIVLRRYGVAHFHGNGSSLFIFLIRIFKPKTAVLGTFHCQDYYHDRWGNLAKKTLAFGEKMMSRFSDRTISVSKNLSEWIGDNYKRVPVVISNGAEVERTEKKDFLDKWKLEKKKFFFAIGKLIKHKGLHYAIEAFKELDDSGRLPKNFKFVIVGEGFQTDDYVQYLKTLTNGRRNIVMLSKQSEKNLEQLFSHAYIFLHPSEMEGFSINLLEAMGHSLAPLASDIKGNREIIGEAGYYFETGNIKMLTDKMAYLINCPNEVKRMGEKGRIRISEKYSWDSVSEKTLELYRDVVLSKISR